MLTGCYAISQGPQPLLLPRGPPVESRKRYDSLVKFLGLHPPVPTSTCVQVQTDWKKANQIRARAKVVCLSTFLLQNAALPQQSFLLGEKKAPASSVSHAQIIKLPQSCTSLCERSRALRYGIHEAGTSFQLSAYRCARKAGLAREVVQSNAVTLVASLSKYVVLIIFMTHGAACIWHYVSATPPYPTQ